MENTVNFSRIAVLGVLAFFPWLRRTIGVLALLGTVVGGLMAYSVPVFTNGVVVNTNPVCDRVAYQEAIKGEPPLGWGHYIKPSTATTLQRYVREANGTGWCLVKVDPTIEIRGLISEGRMVNVYVHRWYEVPSKYGEVVQANVPPSYNTSFLVWAGIALFSAAVFFFLWLPATILAAIGRSFLRDVKSTDVP
jgi:hypothetical protein